jgi:hypothetical protein
MSPYPPKECPRYDKCSVNSCPLDPEQAIHKPDTGDRDRKCTMEKGVRSRIGQKYPDLLPLKGLTRGEWSAALLWSKIPPAEREARSKAGRQRLIEWRTKRQEK